MLIYYFKAHLIENYTKIIDFLCEQSYWFFVEMGLFALIYNFYSKNSQKFVFKKWVNYSSFKKSSIFMKDMRKILKKEQLTQTFNF
jgi:hypothetical protein